MSAVDGEQRPKTKLRQCGQSQLLLRVVTAMQYYAYMFGRKRVVQNEAVACHMRAFFRTLNHGHRSDPEAVAKRYGQFLWGEMTEILVDEKLQSRSRFYVGLSTGNSSQHFERITKSAALISDTLLLSHDWTGEYCQLGEHLADTTYGPEQRFISGFALSDPGGLIPVRAPSSITEKWEVYGMHCPSLAGLGNWILDTKLLLKAGLAWYLPSYSISKTKTIRETHKGMLLTDTKVTESPWSFNKPKQVKAIDYLIRDGRAVDASGAEPIKSHLVRPVLYTELPFIEGVNLREFSEITMGEFASYSAFRDFLRQRLLEMDGSLNSVQSDRELVKLGLEIKDQVRSVRSEMERVRRKRAVAVSGAVIGSVGAILVTVYGPALAAAVAAIGASGGVWGVIHATTENNTRALRENKWYYVWVLAKKSNTHVI